MRALAVWCLPVVEERDGARRPADCGEDVLELECVGWCNALVVEIEGEERWLLLTQHASERA